MITQERLKEVLDYNPETGDFVCIGLPRRGVTSGSIAGTKFHNGGGNYYIKISVDRKIYYAHRLVFLYMSGEVPDDDKQVDHIDGNGLNNSWGNLRLVTQAVNNRNQRLSSTNKSGHIGVSWRPDRGKWVVRIGRKHCGYFHNINDAALMAVAAYERYGYHENHGSIR